jgi:hypothetical protein
MVVWHLVACYWSADLAFSLAPVHAGAIKEAEVVSKEYPEVDTTVAKVIPWLQ